MQFTPFEPVHLKTTALGCFVRPMNMTQNAPMITSVLAADTLSTVLLAYLIYLLICNQQLHHHTTEYTSFFTVCITAQIVGTTQIMLTCQTTCGNQSSSGITSNNVRDSARPQQRDNEHSQLQEMRFVSD